MKTYFKVSYSVGTKRTTEAGFISESDAKLFAARKQARYGARNIVVQSYQENHGENATCFIMAEPELIW